VLFGSADKVAGICSEDQDSVISGFSTMTTPLRMMRSQVPG
jgi:hypothetical protein